MQDRALQSVSQGIIICDALSADQPITYTNPGFERLTGYSSDEVLRRNCRFLQGPKTDRAAIAMMCNCISDGRECSIEVLNYRKDGTTFLNALHIAPVHDEAGRMTHFVGLLTDVTEQRRLEEQFQQSQKMEAIGQLAGGVAHDFNNLLTIISGYSEMLLSMLGPTDPTRASVKAIAEAGERAASLTRQLLAFSRRSVLEPKVIHLNDVVRETGRCFAGSSAKTSCLLPCWTPRSTVSRWTPGSSGQVLMNLAVNARDAMPRGGKLTIETCNALTDRQFLHKDVAPGRYVLLTVSDTGHGMPADVKARIFEPFFTTKIRKGDETYQQFIDTDCRTFLVQLIRPP